MKEVRKNAREINIELLLLGYVVIVLENYLFIVLRGYNENKMLFKD